MRMSDTNNRRYRAAKLAAVLARRYPCAKPEMVARTVFDLQRAAVSWELRRCNEGMTEAQEESGYERLRRLESKCSAALTALAASDDTTHAASVKLGGDPRGCCASLIVPGVPGDGWGDGFAIY